MAAHAAIDQHHDARDVACTGRCEESDGVGDILGLAEVTQCDFPLRELLALVTWVEAADLRGVYEAGLDTVHGDAVLAELLGKALRPYNEACLGDYCGVDHLRLQIAGQADDRALFAAQEIGQQLLGELAVSIEIQRHALHPLLFRGINIHRPAASGIVDQDIDVTECRQRCVCDYLRATNGHEILFEHDRLDASFCLDLIGEAGKKLRVARRREHGNALRRERLYDRAAEALAGAGDERFLSTEVQVHEVNPSLRGASLAFVTENRGHARCQKDSNSNFTVIQTDNNLRRILAWSLGAPWVREEAVLDFVQQLRIFVAVADNGSFARAAAALRMGRPGVTNAVSALEASIGVRLLHRTTRRSSLTGEGELFYERAAQILADVVGAQNLFGGSGQVPKGRLRVDIPVGLAKPIIIPRLPEFTERYPDIEIILGVSDQPVDLLAEGVDCVVRVGELPASSMISRVVTHLPMVSCAAPSYLAAHGVPRNVEDLSAHRAVTYFAGSGRSLIDWHLVADGEERSIRMRSAILVNDSEALVACALAGLGMIQALRASVAEQLETGRLVEILPHVGTVSRPVSIMYPNRQYLAPQVRAFIDWTSSIFGQD